MPKSSQNRKMKTRQAQMTFDVEQCDGYNKRFSQILQTRYKYLGSH